MMAFTIHQDESALIIHVSRPSITHLPAISPLSISVLAPNLIFIFLLHVQSRTIHLFYIC